MKEGHLIALGTPKELITKAHTKNIEEAFIALVEEVK